MPEFDSSGFARSVAGQLLRRLGEQGAAGALPHELSLSQPEQSALRELERLGYVKLERGAGAMSWRVERVVLTESGRAKLATTG